MRSLRMAAFAAAAVVGCAVLTGEATAMPANALRPAAAQVVDGLQDVAYVCGPYRCLWRPGPYWRDAYWGGGPYWGPRPYWGWHRWGWHRWGWHRRWG